MATLRIQLQGQTFEAPLPGTPVSIGSADGNDLKLAVEGIGAEHCVLEPLPDGRYRLRDGGSGYETRVNGTAAKQVALSPGDVLEVGPAKLTLIATAAVKTPPAKPAAAVRPAPAAVPAKAVSAKPAAAPVVPTKSSADRPTPATSAGAPEVAVAEEARPSEGAATRRARARKKKVLLPLVAIALAAAAVIVVSNLQSDEAAKGSELKGTYDKAQQLIEDKQWAEARTMLAPLAEQSRDRRLQESAKRRLAAIKNRETSLDEDLAKLLDQALDYRPEDLDVQRKYYVEEYGEQWLPRFEAMRKTVIAQQANWLDTMASVKAYEAKELMAEGRFGDALEEWRALKRSAPLAIDVDALITGGISAVQTGASSAADKLLTKAERMAKRSGAQVAHGWLAKRSTGFAGTKAEVRVLAELRTLKTTADAEAAAAAAAAPPPSTPSQPTNPATPDQPTPTEPTQPTTPDAVLAAQKALESAAAFVEARQFASAVATLGDAVAAAPAGEWKQTLESRHADVVAAKRAVDALIADIKANGESRYKRIPVSERLKATLVDADEHTISTLVRGGRSKFKWSRATPRLFGALFGRAKPEGDAALDAATLLHVIGDGPAASQMAFVAGQTGVDTARLFPLLARWRGEPVPEGGYVVHEDSYVTPARRDFLVREAKIVAALAQTESRKAEDRQAAYAELLAIGEPARERFEGALMRRRDAIIDEVANNKAFRSGKHKSKLFTMLQSRRKSALALIFNSQAYPYPNPNKRNQKEVEALVDKVREVWERPFDLIAQWDKNLKAELERVTEVDEILVQIDPGYDPDLKVVKERINKAIDMPSFAPGGKEAGDIAYSRKVLAFNERIKLTATEQEKDNTRAVNEYRMMMGRRAVKINERLLRGSRGHSRHMRENKYFAHNVPGQFATPQNRTPGSRAKVQGYGGGVGENIAMGPSTGRGAFWAWFGSSGHHRNMLSNWTEMGCGRSGNYWTQLFGGAGGSSLSEPETLPDPAPEFAPEEERQPRRRGARLPDRDGGLFDGDE